MIAVVIGGLAVVAALTSVVVLMAAKAALDRVDADQVVGIPAAVGDDPVP
jgi:hypothetical protein